MSILEITSQYALTSESLILASVLSTGEDSWNVSEKSDDVSSMYFSLLIGSCKCKSKTYGIEERLFEIEIFSKVAIL